MQSRDLTQLTQTTLARRVLVLQAILTLVATLGAMPFGSLPALSVLIGGGVCLAGNGAVVLWIFRDYRAQATEALAARLYGAEAVKIALVLGLFAVAFTTVDGLHLPSLLGSYLLIQVLPPIAAAQTLRPPKAPDHVR